MGLLRAPPRGRAAVPAELPAGGVAALPNDDITLRRGDKLYVLAGGDWNSRRHLDEAELIDDNDDDDDADDGKEESGGGLSEASAAGAGAKGTALIAEEKPPWSPPKKVVPE